MTEATTLQQSFEKLALEKRPRLLPPDRSKPSGPAQYPPLPEGFKSHERHYVLGWKLDIDWFASFTERYFHNKQQFGLGSFKFGYFKLKAMMGYNYLFWMIVIPNGEPVPEDMDDPSVAYENIFVISVTASDYLHNKRRPTQAQYEWLVNVIGEEPAWYRDALPKEEFYENYSEIC